MFRTYRFQRLLARIDREIAFLAEWGDSLRASERGLHQRRLDKMFTKAFNLVGKSKNV